ncbi:PadR family transcriptional regulator [Paenibacillus albidus]|uniref:PadR family transcriptional regulator n=1 Tax=Paenibacillus albidus TaxID=2041023 RepID=A0A917D657_9BACL|nr:PadR family transcriptional regulator [Paenibacillus albidus]MBT2289382.1 helix-turn-helix transcriptional regulator [Paenibacillus albidus]GGG10350.1 PadR family transcriptional regulator [Paenibacillus albidus]
MEFGKELLKGYIDIILLSLLQDRPMYGYEIAKAVREASGGAFDMKEATLYMALKRLEKQGALEAFWGGDTELSGGGRRKYYRLLAQGEQQLQGSREGWSLFRNLMDSLLGGDKA